MPAFDQAQVDKHFSEALDSLVKGDKVTLKQIGQRDGFVNNKIRALVWPCLLDCSEDGYALYEDTRLDFPDVDERDRSTIQQDVRRSFTRFPEEKRRAELEDKLQRILEKVLRIHPRLHYVQGFHDVAEVLLLVVDDEGLSCKLLHRLSLFNLRDMLLPSLEPTLNSLDIIPAILQRVDTTLYRRVLKAVRPPHFAASAVMTWFSHEIDNLDKVATVFDFLLCSPPTMIFYLAAAVILNSKPEILARYDEDDDDFAAVYSRLTKVLRSRIPFTVVFPLAIRLLKKVPPETLDVYTSLSRWSCYKARGRETSNWIEDGAELLREATEEQYRVKETETHTEITRREKTLFRQELADAAMKRYSRDADRMQESDEAFQKRIELVKQQALIEQEQRWQEMEEERVKEAAEEKERLLRAQEFYKQQRKEESLDYSVGYWGIIIGGTAIAGAIIAIMKGYHYI